MEIINEQKGLGKPIKFIFKVLLLLNYIDKQNLGDKYSKMLLYLIGTIYSFSLSKKQAYMWLCVWLYITWTLVS